MFRDRVDAGSQLAEKLKGRALHDPLVLAIPRGGVVVGSVLARLLGADLDVVLSRKLRAPGNPEYAIGAISEDGTVYLDAHVQSMASELEEYLQDEIRLQQLEIERRRRLIRELRPPVAVAGRTAIVTDDGIATGSTMIAALKVLRAQRPLELLVAVPVASPDRLEQVKQWSDEAICLLVTDEFWSIGQFYGDFSQVGDREMLRILAEAPTAAPS